ncbi:hypothetical protein BDZ97DRAFT_1791252 [Flammula alnicola]|nr:hypothetical protein BDZ97DRAFT_1791252 [Flammula alnicola]
MLADLPPFDHTSEFKYTASPNPGWTFGQGIQATPEGRAWAEGEKEGWTVVDTSTEESRKVYSVMIAGIVPRPVAFVSSVSEDGIQENLAPFSWFNQVAPNPPLISLGCVHQSKGAKDTVRNIRATKGFTVNIISEPWIEQANAASIDAPYEISEWPITGLTKAASIHVKAPRVKESAFSMECELYQAIDIPDPKTNAVATTLILGHVEFIHMRNDILDPQRGIPDAGKFKAIARMGGLTYGKVSEVFALPRPSWNDVGEKIREDLGGALDVPSNTSNSA